MEIRHYIQKWKSYERIIIAVATIDSNKIKNKEE